MSIPLQSIRLQTRCKNCQSNSVWFYILAWTLYILIFIPALFWSTQQHYYSNNQRNFHSDIQVEKYQKFSLLKHYEVQPVTRDDWLSTILYSSVCPLGKVSFYILVFLMLIYLLLISIKRNDTKIITWIFGGIFALVFLLYLFMNWPLFIRSIPAIIVLGGILTIGGIVPN